MEEKALRDELNLFLQASITAFGKDGVNLAKFIDNFKEDWPTKDLVDYAKKLGFGDGHRGVSAMLKTFPEYLSFNELPNGQIHLKPIANEDTKENLELINKTNKEIQTEKYARESAREKAIKQRLAAQRPSQNPNLVPLGRPTASAAPPPPLGLFKAPPLPLAFNAPPLRANAQKLKAAALSKKPPLTSGGSKNANLEPLGSRRPLSSNAPQSSGTAQSKIAQRVFLGLAQRNQQQPMRNDFGDMLQRECTNLSMNRPRPSNASLKQGSGEKNFTEYPDSTEYYADADDFHAPASNKGSGICSSRGSREHIEIWNEEAEGDDEEEEGEEMFSEAESEWDFDVGMGEEREEDNAECANFLVSYSHQFASIQSDLHRLVSLFHANKGRVSSSSMFDALKNAYNAAYKVALTPRELNRILGSPETIKIAKDSFRKCQWPASAMFSVIEKTGSNYTFIMEKSLTDAFVDPSLFIRKPSSSTAHQTPTTPSAGPSGGPMGSGPTITPKASPAPPNVPSPSGVQEGRFAELAIYAHQLLKKAKSGSRKSLTDLYNRIRTTRPGEFPAMMATKGTFAGYLHEYFDKSFKFDFQGDDIFLSLTDLVDMPKWQKPTGQTRGTFRSGDRHKVKLMAYTPNAIPQAVLQLSEIWHQLQKLLKEYAQILDALGETGSAINPSRDQLIFFLAPSRNLCRGQFMRKDGPERAIVLDIDSGNERFIYSKEMFEIPHTFPAWRFPPCHFLAHFDGNQNEAKLAQFFREKREFTVDFLDTQKAPKFYQVKLVEESE